MEGYKKIKDTRYLVSADGNVYSTITKKKLKFSTIWNGYKIVKLYVEPKSPKSFLVHRLVAAAFIGDIPKGMQINHIDGNKINNNLDNLEIVTQSENMIHSIKVLGSKREGNKHRRRVKRLSDGMIVDSIIEAQKVFGVNKGIISANCRNKNSKGYPFKNRFEYVGELYKIAN